MRSWDPMRNFPELDGMEPTEARQLVRDTQKRITREPKIMIGLVAIALIGALVWFSVIRVDSMLNGFIAGGLVGLTVVVYMVVIVKPRMKQAFRELGYPRRT